MPQVGRKASGKHTQSVVFMKAAGWTKKSSREWCSSHKFHTDGHDENATQHRWRQYDPENAKFNYVSLVIQTKNGKTSIMYIRGIPK